MLIKLSKNSYIRTRQGYGYIYNQLTKWDRLYTDSGRIFLNAISRECQEIDDLVLKLSVTFPDVEFNILKNDFLEFINDLEKNKYVVIGKNIEETEEKDIDFSYSLGNMKIQTADAIESETEKLSDTMDLTLKASNPELISIQFELTGKCNERCVHCYIPNKEKDEGNELSLEKIKMIIEEFSDMGGLEVTLSGGEALLHSNFMEIVELCRKKDLVITILSNLIALTDNQIKKLKEYNVSLLQVSLYSMNPEHHDAITQVKGSFYRTISSIERLVKANVPVQISCPVMHANRKDYKDVILYAKKLNIKAQTDFIMMAQSNFDNQNLSNRISLNEIEYLLRDIFENDPEYSDISSDEYKKKIKDARDEEGFMVMPICNAGIDTLHILSNGNVIACSGWNNYTVGNLHKNSLKHIWTNSEGLKKIRKISQKDFPKCLDCESFMYCSRCLVRNFNESKGDMMALPEYFCEVAKLNKKIAEEYMNR